MPSNKKLLQAAAGSAGGDNLYVEDVFSTYLYTGTGSAQTITNGIDLDGEGGLVWLKNRSTTQSHGLFDTERTNGASYFLSSDLTGAEYLDNGASMTFNSDGFALGSATYFGGSGSGNAQDYASWSFRKAEKFFDVVTYTGTGSATTISHNLGSVPGVMIIKRASDTESWQVYHKDFATDEYIQLNGTAASTTVNGTLRWNNTRPTDTVFSIGTHNSVNGSGDTYVAYLFASDAGGFGDDENIIKCGSYTGNGGSSLNSVTLGFEPQWILLKNADATGSWAMYDTMRGWAVSASSADDARLFANSSGDESLGNAFNPTATGFEFQSGNATWNNSGNDFIYIAIRRPMKTPEAGTEVFAIDTLGGTAPNPPGFNGVLVDWAWKRVRNTTDDWYSQSRLTGTSELKLNSSDAESTADTSIKFDYQDGWLDSSGTLSTQLSWMFKRATGFFDVVAYTGTGSATTFSHNLKAVPELMIVKQRSGSSESWTVWNKTIAATNSAATLWLNSTSSVNNFSNRFNSTAPTDSVFSVEGDVSTNGSGSTYVNYLFATLDGVSKVGSYTGTGADLNVDCGFSAGARFILIKRTDSTGDWYTWNYFRGITAGNDPYLLLNTTAAEATSTDYIDPLNAGFTVTSSAPAGLNASGGTYIFMAIS
ncbi:hypothetical protein OAV62_00775 [bacterium]|nr:hypothetical protein [bacterium]